jgi:peptidase E
MNRPKQVYLLAGGRSSNSETLISLIRTVFEENRLTSPIVAYVGTANKDNESFLNRIAGNLTVAGASIVNHALISPNQADLEKACKILDSSNIIFISGGDVEEGINMLKEKGMIEFLRRLYKGGKPFFGLSAGSIMLAKSWVRWSNPEDNSTAELFPCLDFASIICDTHGEEDNWEELKTALKLSKDGEKGYGILSGTAIKVNTDRSIEALGGVANQFIHSRGKVIRLPDILPTT